MLNSLVNGITDIYQYVSSVFGMIKDIFKDIAFRDLWVESGVTVFPLDISSVLDAVVAVLIFIALVSLVKKLVFFLGGL